MWTIDSRWTKWSVQVFFLLCNSKQNNTSLSLLAGTTVVVPLRQKQFRKKDKAVTTKTTTRLYKKHNKFDLGSTTLHTFLVKPLFHFVFLQKKVF